MSITGVVGSCCRIDFKIESYLICIEGWRNTIPAASQTGLRLTSDTLERVLYFMATYNGQVTGGGLNLRASASTSSSKLVQIPDETKIVVSDYSGNSSWYCTTYGSYSGFVMKQYVTILSNVTSQSATVTGGGLNLRTYPSTSASSPVQIPSNTKITIQKHNSTWSSTTYNGHSGFVMTQYLTIGGSTGGGGTGGSGSITDDGSTGDTSNSYIGAKCVGNIKVYERDNDVDIVILQYYGTLNGSINVYDAGNTDWFNYSTDGKVYRKQIDISYCKKPATTVMGTSTLRNGSSGRYVMHLQHYLNRYLSSRNYAKITVDGSFGSGTQGKVESFQQYWNSTHDTKLDVDGIVGANTRTALAQYVHSL